MRITNAIADLRQQIHYTSGDNILNGFCQTAKVQCAMLIRRGSLIWSRLCLTCITTIDRICFCADGLRREVLSSAYRRAQPFGLFLEGTNNRLVRRDFTIFND